MFKNTKAFSSFSVDDIEKARHFYAETLGLTVKDEEMGLISLNIVGDTTILIYPKPDHTPAKYTILNFSVSNIDEAVDTLTKLGVTFEQYDMPGLKTDERGIAKGEPTLAWFTDPAGNILSLIED